MSAAFGPVAAVYVGRVALSRKVARTPDGVALRLGRRGPHAGAPFALFLSAFASALDAPRDFVPLRSPG
jgi:hypothetical protein